MSKILLNKSNVDLDYPICRPSLDLDFTQEVLDERITFSRGSIGTIVNRNRLIETVSANQPRFDYDPVTGECKGLLVEESRSNVRSNSENITSVNYAVGSATLTQLTTTTPISGLATATKFFLNVGANAGNSSEGFNFGSGISLSNSTVYTQSIFIKASGSSTFRLRSNVTGQVFDIPIAGPAPAPTGTITSCSVTPYPDGWSRISWTFTTTTSIPGNRADHWAIKTNIADGSSGFLVTGAQLETGAFPTSYIPTTASTVTRSADLASMTGTNFSSWYNQTEGTFYISGNASYSFQRSFGVSIFNNSSFADNRISIRMGNTFIRAGAEQFAVFPQQTKDNWKLSFGLKQNDVLFVLDGSRFTPDKNVTLPTNLDTLEFGKVESVSSSLFLNGTISRFTYYPRALKPNQLQLLTQ